MDKAQRLGLYCEPLDDFRSKLDQLIQMLMLNLTERDLKEGTVTGKIKIVREITQNRFGMAETRIKLDPSINLKIGASGSAKCTMSNNLMLVYTDDGEPVIGESQISIDEYIRKTDERGA